MQNTKQNTNWKIIINHEDKLFEKLFSYMSNWTHESRKHTARLDLIKQTIMQVFYNDRI